MAVTTPAHEYTTLADARVKVNDIIKLGVVTPVGKHTSAWLHNKYPWVLKATFDTMQTAMTVP